LIDLAQVVIRRTFDGKPFWIGDTNHISHWLARQNLSRSHAVLLIWLATTMIGILAAL
jgi:UDP-GlcNAc:undecaprenyl-phosphate GlcNAc-1-phosphate transferase